MRILKNKIAQYQAQAQAQLDMASFTDQSPQSIISSPNSDNKKRRRVPGQCKTPEASRQTKNVVKNYGKAISKFSTSALAMPYLFGFLQREGVELAGFISFVNDSKKMIDGLQHFRSVLLPNRQDQKEIVAYKRILRDIGTVFIKFFSVNWIYHSKVQHKEAHLKFRFKMLRRIRRPELFTYLKVTKGNKKNQAF